MVFRRVLLVAGIASVQFALGKVTNLKTKLNDGTDMPVIGLGTWKSPPGEVEAAVRHALCKTDVRHIDAAQIYQNSHEVGKGIGYAIDTCGLARKDIWVTSKVWNADFRPEDVPAAVDRILAELGLDYVDQLLLHWPTPYQKPPAGCPPDCPASFAGTDDPQRPRGADGKLVLADLEEQPLWKTWQALIRARDEGKVRSIGVSNFSPAEIDGLKVGTKSVVPAVNQVEAHVFWNQAALRSAMQERGIVLVAYSPLGNPAVYGHKLDGMNSNLVGEIAAESGLAPAQVMLNFLISLGDIVVPKSVTPSRIESNFNFKLKLTDAQIDRLAKEAPQARLTNPKNRPGGISVFDDSIEGTHVQPRVVVRGDEL